MSLLTSLLAPGNASRTAVKSANETVNNSATAQNDDSLSTAVVAGGTYKVEAFLIYSATTTADFRLGWSAPAGSTFHWAPMSLNSGAGGLAAAPDFQYNQLADEESIGGVGAGAKVVARPLGLLIVGGTAGTLTVKWAQVNAEASDTIVYAGSYLRVERLA